MQVIDFTLLQEFDSSSHNHPTVQMTHKRHQLFRVSETLSLQTTNPPFMVWLLRYGFVQFILCVHIFGFAQKNLTSLIIATGRMKRILVLLSRESSFKRPQIPHVFAGALCPIGVCV